MQAYIPCFISIMFTCFLLDFIRQRQRRVKATFTNFHEILNLDRMKKVMLGITVWIAMITFPNATSRLFYPNLVASPTGKLLIRLTDSWIFTFHALNFFLLIGTNKFFKDEVAKMFRVRSIKFEIQSFIQSLI